MTDDPQQPSNTDVGRPREMGPTTVTTPTDARRHSQPQRGMDVIPSSTFFGGRFGRMFRNLPVHEHAEESLRLLALTMIAVPDAPPDKPGGADKELGDPDEDENTFIPAGYTYLGQFIDHDITFDPASSLQRQNDPDALQDFRTPRFDLDSVYGRGPSDQPYLYAPDADPQLDGVKFLLGRFVTDDHAAPNAGPDLPRNVIPDADASGHPQGRALIGDPRNDENLIVSQLQSTMLRFHNAVVDHLRTDAAMQALNSDDLLKEAQRVVRWHYQWVVVKDFLARICGNAVVGDVLGDDIENDRGAFVVGGSVPGDNATQGDLDDKTEVRLYQPRFHFYQWQERPYMPVEFSIAAYRFGHSMVRPSYFFNDVVRDFHEQQHSADPDNVRLRTPIFGPPNDDVLANLNGFRPLPDQWGFQWKYFFPDIEAETADGKPLPQPSYKIDTTLVNPLGMLPPAVAVNPSSLAERNLLRGLHFDLPSGQRVARAMGLAPMSDHDLELNSAGLQSRIQKLRAGLKANLGFDDGQVEQRIAQMLQGIGITDGEDVAIHRAASDLANEAPLWYYILHEAETQAGAHRLGPVGGRIVAEVLIGLLWGDPLSYLQVEPNWTPAAERLSLPASTHGAFTMTDLVRFATGQ